MKKHIFGAVLLLALGGTAFAAQDDYARVEVKGILQEDRDGMFIKADGKTFDINFNKGEKIPQVNDLIVVSGKLNVEEMTDGKPKLVVNANRVTVLEPANVKYQSENPPPVIRERVIEERRHGVDLPGVHVHW